ncbi:NAD(P)/FAD-dependent oxidoreductase [Neobacillus niacini]|uniref:flavin-containing monooxygenase n=1 Tax=Neobacillus niacini TaxID=86668 RepID=UPI003000F6FB
MIYDVAVIGAGQAGLAMGFYLKQKRLSFVILDKGSKIGESWKERYDSLKLFTPRSYSSLPGLSLEGEQNIYPTKNEISDYLIGYTNTFSLPIQLNTTITKLAKVDERFILSTNQGEYQSKNVVVATGPFQQPNIPDFSKHLSGEVLQLHSSEYKNSRQLIKGTTVIVGGGNSGAQIAVELSHESEVFLSVGHRLTFLPQDIGNKSIFCWFDKLGIYKANVNSKVGQFIKNRPDPIFGFELKSQLKNRSVILKSRVVSADEKNLFFDDGSSVVVSNVIWSTGFKSDYRWIDIPSVVDEKGALNHQRGVTPVKGLYFLGLPWQSSRGSALLQGVGTDAEYIFKQL